MVNIIAAGGGREDDSKLIDELFVSMIDIRKKTLYIPLALDNTIISYQNCFQWFNTVFKPFGLSEIELCDDIKKAFKLNFADFSSVYIGGGNTFKLLKLFSETGFRNVLLEFALK